MITPAQYKAVFKELLPNMDGTKKQVLQILMSAPNNSSSPTEILRLLQRSHIIIVNQAIGQVGSQVFAKLKTHPDGLSKGKFQMWHIIAKRDDSLNEGFKWKLRPEVVIALTGLRFSDQGFVLPEEIESKTSYFEGSLHCKWVNAYERNKEARVRCIGVFGSACVICAMDFGDMYGDEARGFIHVHHLLPLAEIKDEYEVNPEADLRPVCPNCHAVIHLNNRLRSIKEVKEMIAIRKTTINRT